MKLSSPCRRFAFACMAVAMSVVPAAASAQDEWPAKTVRVVVGYPPGSSPDLVARVIAEPLAQALGKPVIVENKAGAGGTIGVQAVLAAKDDHTFGITTNGPLTTAKQLYVKLPYDPLKDVVPISLAATSPTILIVNTNAPPTSLKEFIQWAKSQPGGISYGSIGKGSGSHLTMELFAGKLGLQMLHVPFSGFSEVTAAVVRQDLNAAFMAPSGALAQAKAGKVRILGISSAERSPLAPDVPTIAEAAGLPGFNADLWVAAFAHQGMPARAVTRLSKEINAILQQPEVKAKLLAQGWQAIGGSPSVLSQRIQEDTALWGQVIRDAKVEPQ